jgi:hypothetical protein
MRATASANQSIQLRRSLQAVSSFFCRVISFFVERNAKGWVSRGGWGEEAAGRRTGGCVASALSCLTAEDVSHIRMILVGLGSAHAPAGVGWRGGARSQTQIAPTAWLPLAVHNGTSRHAIPLCSLTLPTRFDTDLRCFFRQLYIRSLGQHGLLPSLRGQQ